MSPVNPLLKHADGSFLAKFQFVGVFRKGIRALELDDSLYVGHYFFGLLQPWRRHI